MVELRHIGGALGRYAGGALSRFDGEYLYFAAGVPMDPAVVAALEAHFALVGAAIAAHKRAAHYLNFAERATDPVAFYGEERYARLRKIKAEVDPLEIFRANHEIPAAGGSRLPPATGRQPRPHGCGRGVLRRQHRTPWPSRARARAARGGAGPRPRSRGRSPSAPAARRRCAPPRASAESIVPSQQPRKPIGIVTRPGNVSDDGEPWLSGPGHTGGLSTIMTIEAITPKATPVSAPTVLKRRHVSASRAPGSWRWPRTRRPCSPARSR